jgi:hypothetical protein
MGLSFRLDGAATALHYEAPVPVWALGLSCVGITHRPYLAQAMALKMHIELGALVIHVDRENSFFRKLRPESKAAAVFPIIAIFYGSAILPLAL